MNKHTPGPWRESCDKPKARNAMALVATSASSAYARTQAIDCTGSGNNYAEDCANARLIAAAPDMLAMLERVTSEYNALGRVVDPVLGANNSTISEARALLAKIKGE